MVTFLLQLSAQPNKILRFCVGRNVGMWAEMWAVWAILGWLFVSAAIYCNHY